MIESAIRFGFGGSPRDFAIPLRRDWSFGFLQVGPQQVENVIIAAVAMTLLFLFLCSPPPARRCARSPTIRCSPTPRASTRTAWRGSRSASAWGSPASAACWSGSTPRSIRWSASAPSCRCSPPRWSAGSAACRARWSAGLRSAFSEELSLLVLPATYKTVVGFLAILLILTLRPSGLLGSRSA